MNFPFYIARRYLFSKKSHNAINVISAISVCGVALATLALVCTLSVFNGFQDLVTTFFTAFDSQLKITAVRGLRAVAHGGNGFFGVVELPHDFQQAGIEAQIFRRASAGDDQAGVVRHLHLIKVGVDGEVVAAFFGIGLVTLKIVDGRAHRIARLFARADGVDFIAQHLQHLERNHHLVVFHIVAGQYQNFFHCVLHQAPRERLARLPCAHTYLYRAGKPLGKCLAEGGPCRFCAIFPTGGSVHAHV